MQTTTRHQKNNIYCLIYALRNHKNDKVYIGQTWRSLKERMNTGYEKSIYLNRAMEKYGKEQFYYDVLTIANTQEMADYWEIYFVKKYDSTNRDKGYNLREGGTHGPFPLQSRMKMSSSHLGSKQTDEQKEKASIAKRGEKNPASKITAEIAREIYISYHNDLTKNCYNLAKIYGLNKGTINEIVLGKSWVDATKDLINTGIRKQGNGKDWSKAKLTVELVKEIKQKLATGLYSYVSLGNEYGVIDGTIRAIAEGITWKHVI
jgi:group I intron endonuclease